MRVVGGFYFLHNFGFNRKSIKSRSFVESTVRCFRSECMQCGVKKIRVPVRPCPPVYNQNYTETQYKSECHDTQSHTICSTYSQLIAFFKSVCFFALESGEK